MGKLFILIKRKGSKRFIGVIPAKRGATRAKLQKQISRNIKKGFSFKIVNLVLLNKIIKRQRPRIRKIKRGSRRKRKRPSMPKRRRTKSKKRKSRKRRLKRKRRKGRKR